MVASVAKYNWHRFRKLGSPCNIGREKYLSPKQIKSTVGFLDASLSLSIDFRCVNQCHSKGNNAKTINGGMRFGGRFFSTVVDCVFCLSVAWRKIFLAREAKVCCADYSRDRLGGLIDESRHQKKSRCLNVNRSVVFLCIYA